METTDCLVVETGSPYDLLQKQNERLRAALQEIAVGPESRERNIALNALNDGTIPAPTETTK